jgi:hypothetical protein
MNRTKLLSAVVVALVAIWVGGSLAELLLTTLSGSTRTAAGVTVALVGAVVLATVAVGARGRRWLENPDAYW